MSLGDNLKKVAGGLAVISLFSLCHALKEIHVHVPEVHVPDRNVSEIHIPEPHSSPIPSSPNLNDLNFDHHHFMPTPTPTP